MAIETEIAIFKYFRDAILYLVVIYGESSD